MKTNNTNMANILNFIFVILSLTAVPSILKSECEVQRLTRANDMFICCVYETKWNLIKLWPLIVAQMIVKCTGFTIVCRLIWLIILIWFVNWHKTTQKRWNIRFTVGMTYIIISLQLNFVGMSLYYIKWNALQTPWIAQKHAHSIFCIHFLN